MGHVTRKRLEQLFREVQSTIAFDQPELVAAITGNQVRVEGVFAVLPAIRGNFPDGALGKYHLQITFERNYPTTEPKVLELGRQIPRTPDYHINGDGTCCYEVWETWIATSEDLSVQAFFDGPLRNFFLGQLHKKVHGEFPFGEHSHGNVGILNAYAQLLGCEPNAVAVSDTLKALTYQPPRGHWLCPCGSGKKIRNCCRERLIEIGQKVNPELAKRMFSRIKR